MDGRRVAQYQFLEKLGVGGMGEVFKAQDTRLNRIVAIKVLPGAKAGDPERRKRFLLEAQSASSLNHPSVITIHDVISEGDTEFMVMEYVGGRTLNDLIPKGGLRVPQALKYALQIADALSIAHSAGIVHRDLKPSNIMITESGLVKILDFGLAKFLDSNPSGPFDDDATVGTSTALTVEGSIIGTVSYMSPEQAQGKKVDARSDIFSFGVVMYEMLTGRRAFDGESSLSTLTAILRDEARPMIEVTPDVPPQFETIIQKCLRKNPDDRAQSMREVLAELSALKRDSDTGSLYNTRILPAPSKAPSAVSPARGVKGRNFWAAIVLAVLSVVLVAEIGLWIWRNQHSAPIAASQPPAAGDASSSATSTQTQDSSPIAEEKLTNDRVLALVSGKVPIGLILSHIRAAKATAFDLSTAELIRLTKAGVPAEVIDQMRDPKRADIGGSPDALAKQVTDSALAPSQESAYVSLTDGAPLKIALSDPIPADAALGRPLRFTVKEEFRVQGILVIPKGAAVQGAISETPSKKGLFGIGNGKLNFSLSKAEAAGGQFINLRVRPTNRSDGPTQRQVEVSSKREKDTAAAAGTEYIAYIDGAQNVKVPKR